MAFSINTNVSAMNASLSAGVNSSSLDKTIEALASGVKEADAASLALSGGLSTQVSSLGQGIQNANESIGMIQIADGGMSSINDNMQRVRTLTLQASNGTLNADDRASIQKEIDSLLEVNDSIAKTTSYNGINLLDGTGGSNGDGTFTTQTGVNAGETQSFTIPDTQVASLVGTIDVTTEAGLASALDTIDNSFEKIGSIRSELGASQNQLMSTVRNTTVTQLNTAAAESQMSDVDFALESANFSRENLLAQTGSYALAQSNALNAASVLG